MSLRGVKRRCNLSVMEPRLPRSRWSLAMTLQIAGEVNATGRLRTAACRFEADREFLDLAHAGDVAQQQATLVSMVEREHAGADRLAGDDPKLVGLAGWERRGSFGVEETPGRAPRPQKHSGGPPPPCGSPHTWPPVCGG